MGRAWDEKDRIPRMVEGEWMHLSADLDQFKRMMVKADKEALKNQEKVPDPLLAEIDRAFDRFAVRLNRTIGDRASLCAVVKNELGARVQRELLPYLLMIEIGERTYAKPRGYTGDFLTIEIMYRNRAGNGCPVPGLGFQPRLYAHPLRAGRRQPLRRMRQTGTRLMTHP